MKEHIKKEVIAHTNNLIKLFKLKGFETEAQKLSFIRKIRRLEFKAHKLITNLCNGEINLTEEEFFNKEKEILNELDKLLNFKSLEIPCFLNGDCRGYALKIKDSYIREKQINIFRDFGGFGIICPEFS